MMAKIGKKVRIRFALAISVVVVACTSFQNCTSGFSSFMGGFKGSAWQIANGGGEGSDGMKFQSYAICSSGTVDVSSVLKVSSDFSQAFVLRSNCVDLPSPAPISTSQFQIIRTANLTGANLLMDGQIYDQQVDQNLQRITLGYCATSDSAAKSLIWTTANDFKSRYGQVDLANGSSTGILGVNTTTDVVYASATGQSSNFTLSVEQAGELEFSVGGGAVQSLQPTCLKQVSPFQILPAPSLVSVASSSFVEGDLIQVSVTDQNGNLSDSVVLVPVGGSVAVDAVVRLSVNGQSSLSFVAPATAGQYVLVLTDGANVFATSSAFSVTAPIQPTVIVNSVTYPAGANATVTVVNGPANPTDWVGLITGGETPQNGRIAFQYLNGSTSQPTTGRTSATLTFSMPTTPGPYFFVFGSNNTWTIIATGPTLTVMPPPPPVLTVAEATVGLVAPEQVTFANGTGNPMDWIGLIHGGQSPETGRVSYQYLNGIKSGTLTFTTPDQAGPYYLVYGSNNQWVILASSPTFNVSGPLNLSTPTLTLNGSSFTSGQPISVTVTNGPGNNTDWIGLVVADETPQNGRLSYQYLNGGQLPAATGVTSANLTFTAPAAGQYYFVFGSNNSWTILYGTPSFTVTP